MEQTFIRGLKLEIRADMTLEKLTGLLAIMEAAVNASKLSGKHGPQTWGRLVGPGNR